MQRTDVAERHHVALGYGSVIDTDTPFSSGQIGRSIRCGSGGRSQGQKHDQHQRQTPAQQAQERQIQGAGSERADSHSKSVTLELHSRLKHGV